MHALSAQDFLRSATNTAHHYGFSSLERLKSNPACKECGERVEYKASANERRNDALSGILTSGMCSFFDNKLHAIDGPTLFYSFEQVPRTGDLAVVFHVFGVKKSIAEALLIQTIRSFLYDVGYENHMVRVNSLGDTDSVTRYLRELTTYFRKRLDEMPAAARELMKEHPLFALMHLIDKDHDLAKRSPNPLEYLSDTSRKHFREIVEFLDMSGTPFEIDPRLVGHHECYSDALFSFDIMGDEENAVQPLYIRGGRYNTFIQKTSRSKTSAVGAAIILRDKKAPANIPNSRYKGDPSVFLVQLGFGPKIRSLMLIDDLKRAGVMVRQNVMSDSLSEQLRQAEAQNAHFAVILGQKEYVENRVILRNLRNQTQEHVPVPLLAEHLRKATAV